MWNDATGSCGDNEYIYTMYYFDDICENISPSHLIQDAYDGGADMNDGYFTFGDVEHNPTAIITFNDPWKNIQPDVLVDYAIQSDNKSLKKSSTTKPYSTISFRSISTKASTVKRLRGYLINS